MMLPNVNRQDKDDMIKRIISLYPTWNCFLEETFSYPATDSASQEQPGGCALIWNHAIHNTYRLSKKSDTIFLHVSVRIKATGLCFISAGIGGPSLYFCFSEV
jgi:hypothetical protein